MMARVLSRTVAMRPATGFSALAGAAAGVSGTCKWFDSTKGFGFINVDDEEGKEIFVHQTAIHAEGFRSLAEGEPLEFEIIEENGKSKAINVTGPNGDYVQGAPRPPPRDRYNDGYDRY